MNEAELSHKITSIINGFLIIKKTVSDKTPDLGTVVNRVLKTPPESELTVDQYLWSRFNPLKMADMNISEWKRRLLTVLGYWVYNSLLQFPGPLVSSVPAASYLDISNDDISSSEVQIVFKKALYKGPFYELGPFWWTRKIDDILAKGTGKNETKITTGYTMLTRRKLKVKRSICYKRHEGAGFFCIIRKVPVCERHSVSPGEWIPSGADLSRIETGKYEELKPYISL